MNSQQSSTSDLDIQTGAQDRSLAADTRTTAANATNQPEPEPEPEPEVLIVGGLKLFVFGLDQLRAKHRVGDFPSVSVCFFAHGRKSSPNKYFKFCMRLCQDPFGSNNSHSAESGRQSGNHHVIAVAVEQRNHGSRLLSDLQNESWKAGNDRHCYDMWAIQYGTACDLSYLIDVLPFFLPPETGAIWRWIVVGVSLGGHSTLLAMAKDERIKIGISIIGCGDYSSLMNYRAKRQPVFVESLRRHDPVHLPLQFKGRSLLLLHGGDDKLVPSSCSQGFVQELRSKVYTRAGPQEEGVAVLADDAATGRLKWIVEPGVGHTCSPFMEEQSQQWLWSSL
ncbi:uncharacterized protein BJ171DRAFT_487171 [Polychytrium aggregatum]|uniref:uncharacterized protein n=1 Tax=Polychytrium aggregatum TaxID=110093 RepID=UPI0022FE77FA|nr:uncharacterized protein BJ171DRAFT_487171 [Polychytrium aggregatum]KAI9209492.1 hypothetical protein BJ171DRAFT_487171 [Polychytrium aggregatum]